jgi:hypothetical protein
MFLGRKTVRGLQLFLYGIRFAEDFHDLTPSERIGGLDSPAFESWVDLKYNSQRLALNSFGLAAERAHCEEAGFDLWFVWLDEYVASCQKDGKGEPGAVADGSNSEGLPGK